MLSDRHLYVLFGSILCLPSKPDDSRKVATSTVNALLSRPLPFAGKGQLGNFVIAELVNAGFKVTILTRSEVNIKDAPSDVTVAEVDYSSVDSVASALQGIDVLVATLAMDAISLQYDLLEAAMKAGVKRFIPSEYSGITLHPSTSSLPPLAPVIDVQRAVKAAAGEGKIEYTIIAPGGFLNLMFNQPILLNWDQKQAFLYDGGDSKVSVSRLSTIAKVIRAVLEKGDEYKNKIVKVHDGVITQNQLLTIAKEVDPAAVWTETQIEVGRLVEDSFKKLAAGEGSPAELVGAILVAKTMSKEEPLAWNNDDLENAALGIEGLSASEMVELIKARAKGELVDHRKEYEGAWKIDVK